MTLKGSVKHVVLWPAMSLRPMPTPPQKYVRGKDPFTKNYERGAQVVIRRRAVA